MTLDDHPRLVSIQVGMPRELPIIDGDISDKPWTTGFLKQAVERTYVSRTGLAGDGQADLVHHGGPDKAICAYSLANYPLWQETLQVDSLPRGAFGENFTLQGVDENAVCLGDIWQVGETLVVQVSQPRQPCWKLARRWQRKSLTSEVQDSGKTGWYFRVMREGEVGQGAELTLLDRHNLDWTIARANQVMHHEKENVALAAKLAAVPELSESWRQAMLNRVEKKRHTQ